MEYKHFSHQHQLNLYQVQQGQQLRCWGCEKLCSDSIYACWQCGFFLHEHCGNANRFIKHPSHPTHPLVLLPSPTYCSGAFLCNACGETGKAFSYCCALCEVDLHVNCAFLPPRVTHKAHPHDLNLVLTLPKKEGLAYVCKVCNKMLDSKHWNYCCVQCDFHLHTFCATKEVKAGLYVDDEPEPGTTAAQSGPAQAAPAQTSFAAGEAQIEIELTEEAVLELYKIQLLAQMMAATNLGSNV